MPACVCDPTVVDGFHYSEWVATFSGECVYTPLEFTAFLCGLLALACFIVGLLPQMYKNYQRGDVEGLSLGLLIIWATGDVTGFLGAILTPQSVTLRLCSAYFVFLSICSFAQYAYYSNKTALRKLQIEDGDETSTLISEVVDVPEDDRGSVTPASHRSQGYGALDKVVVVSTVMIGLLALAGATEALVIGADGHGEGSSAAMPICGDVAPQTPSARHIGEVAAWISGIMYFSSRIPQLIENHRTKSTEALSLYVFFLTILGNISYCLSILLKEPVLDASFYRSVLPFLLGAGGTLGFDFFIFFQAHIYGCL